AGAHGEPDERDVLQVERAQQDVEVGGEGVVVVAPRRLAGPPEAAPIISDHPVSGVEQRRPLLLPGVPVEGVTVDEHDRTAGAVILVVEPDGSGVLGADGDVRSIGSTSRRGNGWPWIGVRWISRSTRVRVTGPPP